MGVDRSMLTPEQSSQLQQAHMYSVLGQDVKVGDHEGSFAEWTLFRRELTQAFLF